MELSEEKINEIRRSVDIVDIVSEYIPVTQKGRNYFALCPFHDDHNPSLSISPEKQIYTCFVCGAHGNVFNFLMNYENISFIEALKIVANKVGIHLDLPNAKIKKVSNRIEDMYSIYDITCKFYQNNLVTQEGKDALDYLIKRGFTDEIIKTFDVGLSTNKQITPLLKKKYSNELLIDSGIASSSNSRIHDIFMDRIMFPLYDLDGKVVAFSGRIYKTNDSSKYVNSKETEIFKKGKLLYNYHRAKDECRKKKFVIVVEGFMDVIALYMVGITNVVAAMGTAFTKEQAMLLKRLSSNVILCFDGDSAGNKATLGSSKELKEVGIIPKVIRLPDNLDPDEFIKKYGVDKFNEYLGSPKSLLDYKIDELKKDTNFKDSGSISNYIKNVVLELQDIDDSIVREMTIKRLSDDTNISIATINGMLKPIKKVVSKKREIVHLNKYEKAERNLLYYMIRYPEVIRIYNKNKCYFPTQKFRYLVNEILQYYNKSGKLLIADFLTYISDKEEILEAFNEVDTMRNKETYTYDEIIDYINNLNEYSIEEQKKKLTYEFKKETDSIKKEEILKEISDLIKLENDK